jgi:hypothetical protein
MQGNAYSYAEVPDWALRQAVDAHDALVEALREIAKAEGPYAVDRLQHAMNTIENMVAIAEAALASLTDEEPTDG